MIPVTITYISSNSKTSTDTSSFEYFVRTLRHKIHPILDEDFEKLLSDTRVLDLMKQSWDEGHDIGESVGYDSGYDDGLNDSEY